MVATLTNITFSSVQVNWTPVPGAATYDLITLINGAVDTTINGINNNNSYNLTGLYFNQTYSDIYIQGRDSSNNYIGSIQTTGGFNTSQKPILTQSVVNGQVTINWTSFVASPSGTDNYTVKLDNGPYSLHHASPFSIPVGNALSFSIPVDTNTRAGLYDVNVIFNSNASISSDKITVEVPFFISPSGITSTSAILTWNLIEIVTTYSIVLSIQGTHVNTISGLTGNTTTIPNLIPNSTYQVDIFCYNSESPPRQMPYTATNVFTTLDAPQTNTLSVSNNNTSAPTLTWTAPPGNYQVQLNGQLFTTTNNINSLTLSSAVVGDYTAQILAGNGYPASNIVNVHVNTAPVDCVGWFDTSQCDDSCLQTYHVTTPALNGGKACDHADGEQIACNTISCTGCNVVGFTCPEDQVCNSDTGECEPRPVCHTDYDCDEEMYCNQTTGDCENNPVSCTVVDTCAETGQKCDESTGKCIDITVYCKEDADCDGDLVCDQDTGNCIDKTQDCTTGIECGEGFICNEDTGDCILVTHDCNEEGCPENQTCNISTGRCEKIKGTSYLWVLYITIPILILLIWFLIRELRK